MKLGIIIPYRNREEHLEIFLNEFPKIINITDYTIVVVEQTEENLFNRAKLFNIGFDYIKDKIDYVCFHDIDMIPIKADYSYTSTPIHMVSSATQFNNGICESYYGGVNLMSKENFLKINGNSNEFWGWGGEDDDLLNRIKSVGYKLQRREGIYKSLDHKIADKSNRKNNIKKLNSNYNYLEDGLTNLEYIIIEEIKLNEFSTKIKVKL
jgi:predicted glycosyltransferase involved in capsule biosynthesis